MNTIKQYYNSRQENIVFTFINHLNTSGRLDHAKKIIKTLEKLETYEINLLLKIQLVKKIKGYNNIFELIINWKEASYRIFFSIINNNFYLTHIFCKKSNKTPIKEIKLADQRKRELELINHYEPQ